MFGEYAQIASYLPASRGDYYYSSSGDYSVSSLPPHLTPVPPSPRPLWPSGPCVGGRRGRGHEFGHDRGFVEDFVMVAEFSEIEGPKPVLTIPKDAGGSVDKNSLSVKLMAVDHQTSSEGFSISEDTQVVLSEEDYGISAFVHHFVLYDNQARGFVRPYCMVFITPDVRKIMMFYEELSSQFKRAARFLKYGNRLLFVKDLERHLQDLEHTKGYMLNQVGRMRLKDPEKGEGDQSKTRTNAENELYKGLQNIRQSTTEIHDILSILKPILHDHRLESRFRALEERAFEHGNDHWAQVEKLSLQEDWFAHSMHAAHSPAILGGSLKESFISPVSLFKSGPSHTPLLVETKKAKRFNSPLRGLHELCSWGAKEGLRKLRCIHEYFKRDAMVLELEKNESRLMEPSNSMVLHGHCVTSNVLAGVLIRGSPHCVSEDSSSLLMSGDRLQRWPSIASDDTLESFKSVESYLSLQEAQEDSASLYSFTSNNSSSGITTSASNQDFLSAPTSPITEEVAFPPPTTTTITAATPPLKTPSPPTSLSLTTAYSSPRPQPSHNSPPTDGISGNSSPQTSLTQLSCDATLRADDTRLNSGICNTTTTTTTTTTLEANSQKLNGNGTSPFVDAIDGISEQTAEDCAKECHVRNSHGAISQSARSEAKEDGCESDAPSSAGQREGSVGGDRSVELNGVLGTEDSGESVGGGGGGGSQTVNGEHPVCCGSEGTRMPSFVPIMELSPGQKIRATERQTEMADYAHLANSTETPLDLSKMEFSESFKSIADTLSATDESCCDTDTVTDSVCNLQTVSTPSSESCLWKPRNGVYTSGDVLSSLGPGRPGHGIHEVMVTYHSLQPVLYSLMTGRTVLVIGPPRLEMEVIKVVTALSLFLPETRRRQYCVVDWVNRPLKVTDLTRIRLAGVCRSEKRTLDATIPTAVKQYSTLMDVERRVIIGPPYQGTMLNSVLQQKKSFKTDAQHVAYIHSWLMEVSNKAFIFYHSFCLGEAGGLTQSHSVQRHREQYTATICCLMNRLGVRDHDIPIVEYMAEKVKLSQLEPHIWVNVDRGCIVHPLTISSRATQTFRC